MGIVMTHLDELGQYCSPEHATQVEFQPEWEEHNATILSGMRTRPEET
jgi:hypothetical protein